MLYKKYFQFKIVLLASLCILLSGVIAAQSTDKAVEKLPVSGTIKDAVSNKGLVGIRVTVDGFSATISDESGNFTINVPSYNAEVVISGDGYETRNIPLKGRKTISISLLDDDHYSFQQPLTLPFGKIIQRKTTAAAGSYNANGEWKRPDEIPDALLQGQITGLNSIRRSGTPGVGANLFLRGYNSLFATNKPLVVVDGMLYDMNDYGESIIANNYTNPLALINVQDIDNITVLKDASSIYGVKGGNGAILITTARASQQATKIDASFYTGVNEVPDALPVMNAYNYRTYLGEILQSKGMSSTDIAALPYMSDDTSNAEYYRYHNQTDWQKKIFNSGVNRNFYLKVTGGDNIATYALSVGYMKNEGIIKNTDLTRYNTRFNAAFNFSKRFTGAANLSFTYNEQNLKDQGISDKTAPVFLALTKAPFLTDREVNDKGVFSPNLEDTDVFGVSNPSALIETMQAYNKYYRFQGSFKFQYEITKSLKAATLFGIIYDKVRENVFIPRKGVADDTLSNAIADSRLGSQVKRLFSVFSDSYLEFSKVYNRKHDLAARLGLRYQDNDAEQDYALGFNSATDELVSVQNGVTALRQVGGGIGEWNWMNTYFNVDYSLSQKYFFSLNAAMDGSSRFGQEAENGVAMDGVHFAVLPSASFAWLMSSENFMANSKINLWKFRLSYGLSGNDDIGNYTSRQTYGAQNLLGMQGLVRNGIPNPALQWETSKKFNAGFDLAFMNERVAVSFDMYKSKTSNMLVYEELAAPSGFKNVATNDGSMQNTGWETSVNVRVINSANFKWDIGLNIGNYKNEVLSVPGGSFTTEYAGATILTKNGSDANLFYGYKSMGVFSTTAEATAAGLTKKNIDGSYSSFTAGDIHFEDLDGNKIIDENDRQVIGNPNPDYFGGINTRVAYKRFELNAVVTFTKGNDLYNYVRYRLESASGTNNQLNSVINRWRTEGQVTDMPKATYNDPMGNSSFSSRWIEDGSYLRIRSLSVLYNIPIKEKFVKYTHIYAAANNLLTFTKYMGYDPEFSANPSVFSQGIDTGMDPLYRSFTIGVRVGL
ncbi:MAG: SusC/RagA family TonB-linked outer membrane protein [Bacteroidetes bacterium]|nr:MAG: SusC/RagA family TonB-linked outer membrane protein [Bacteroidota bacterium]